MRDIGPFIGLVSVVMIFGIPIVGVIGHYCCAAFKAWLEMSLKREMVARGYTAQEIVEILGAHKDSRVKTGLPDVPLAKPIKQHVYSP
jgi:hypothetical protein